MIELNKIYNMDCLDGLKLIDTSSCDLCLFSPPYDSVRDYKKGEWKVDLHEVGVEISRILKDGGMCVMLIQDQTKDGRKSGASFRTIIDWIDNIGLDLWECCIYQRSGTPGAWWTKRFRVDHEYIPIFIKGKRPQYFNKEHMMIETLYSGESRPSGRFAHRHTDGEVKGNRQVSVGNKKCCGTIINYNSEKSRENSKKTIKNQHPATFPDKFARDFIQTFTAEGMLVVDMFSGSGTSCCMAKELSRRYLGFEISQEYCKISEERLSQIKFENIVH